MKFTILFITILAFNSSDAREKFYKWTDADGNIHYTQKKPANKDVSEINIHNSVSSSPTKNKDDSNTDDEELSADEKEINAYNKAIESKTKTIQDQANCKVARKNLATLQQTVRIRQKDSVTGEFIRIDDTQRMQMLKLARQSIKDLCQ